MNNNLILKEEEPLWEIFMGCNHIYPKVHVRWGGGISFAEHLGKPLSQKLWMDLWFRLGITGLWVVKWDEAVWCISHSCIVRLDKNELVEDIRYCPIF